MLLGKLIPDVWLQGELEKAPNELQTVAVAASQHLYLWNQDKGQEAGATPGPSTR